MPRYIIESLSGTASPNSGDHKKLLRSYTPFLEAMLRYVNPPGGRGVCRGAAGLNCGLCGYTGD